MIVLHFLGATKHIDNIKPTFSNNLLAIKKLFVFIYLQSTELFGELFLHALQQHSMVCLGLYRLRDLHKKSQGRSTKRYVITFPPHDFELSPTDKIFVLIQYNNQEKDINDNSKTQGNLRTPRIKVIPPKNEMCTLEVAF